jgi:hypothetical protein
MSGLPASTTASRRGLWRWAVALLATVLMVVVGSGLVAFAQNGAGASRGPAFLPADAAAYVEGRLDMPDGQADAMAQFMSAFPGFTDTGSFMLKFQEALDGLATDATSGVVSFTGDLQPFMTGEIGLGVMDLTGLAAATTDTSQAEFLIGVAVSDQAAAEAFVAEAAQGADSALAEEAYAESTIFSSDTMAVAVAPDWILLAPTVDLVKTGIDALSGTVPSLADDPGFLSSWARVPTGHLVAAYMDLQALGPLVEMASAASGSSVQGLSLDLGTLDLGSMMAQLPTDLVMYLAAEADRLTVQAYMTPAEGSPAMPLGESELAARFPADTQIYMETRELGSSLSATLAALLQTMDEETAAQMAPLEDMLGAPLPELLDFVSDAGVGASLSSDGLSVGIAAEVTDETVAQDRVERILSIVRLLGAGLGGSDATPITVDEQEIAGTTVTVITLPIQEALGGQLPVTIPETLSVAVADGTLLIGLGDFVETALTQSATDSLAASTGYVEALGDDTTNTGVVYANVSSLLTALDPLLGMMAPEWADIQPYATALDRIIAVGTTEDGVISARMSVIVAP